MGHTEYQRVKAVFYEACEAAEGERAAVLDRACAGDGELRQKVETLLAAGNRDPSFLERPAAESSELRRATEAGLAAADPRRPMPRSIGRYEVVRLIGEGGMGAVYEASQESPRRTVAVKVIRAGMLSGKVLRRFEHEAQLLGRLQHPGIAQIHEAGLADVAWPDGGVSRQPFFAMELVEGEPLTHAARQLSLRQRLALLARVCDAVHHGHQRGVIHRDLKPANILVPAGADPQPKIIDFGVARATDGAATLDTGAGQLIGTLAYMSPEQVAGETADTRADIYALGVIGYETLAGKPPYELDGKPLTQGVAIVRTTLPRSLGAVDRALRGDIETIIAKALEKDPARRYPSASDLAADLRRYLASEPISARPATTLYQLRTFARRNRALAAGAGVAVAGLMLGLAAATWQAVRATAQRDRAVLAERRARDEAEGARRIARCLEAVFAAYDGPGWTGPEDVSPPTARAVLDRSAETIAQELADRPLEQAALLERIGRVYVGMGLTARGRSVLESAVAVRERAGAGALAEAAHTLITLAWACHLQNNDMDALAFQDRAIKILQGAGEAPALAAALSGAADYLINLRRFDEAEARVVQAIGVSSDAALANAMEQLGSLRARRGDPAGAREAFLGAMKARGDAPLTESTLPFALAQAERALGNAAGAEALERDAAAAWSQVPDPLSVRDAGTAVAIAGILSSQGRGAAAEPFLRRAQDGTRAALGEESATAAETTLRLANALLDQGKLAEAGSHYRAALASFRRMAGDEHPDVGTCLFRLAQVAGVGSDRAALLVLRAEAERLYRASVALPESHPHRSGMALLTGYIALALGDAAAAEAPLRECVRVRAATLEPGHRLTAYAQTVLGGCLVVLGRAAEAEAMLPEAVARVRAGYGPGSLMTVEAESRLSAMRAALSASR